MKDWDAMASDWRGQAVPTIDVEALRAEAAQQGRRLRRTLVLETSFAALVVVAIGWIAFQPTATPMETWLFGTLAALLVPYQAYMVWLRRREWTEAGLDVEALLDVETRRCQTTLHYWRVGMWGALVLWLGVYGVLWLGMRSLWPEDQVAGLLGGVLANLVVMPVMGLYGLLRCRQARARCQRLSGLREQLRAP
ncbi:MAG TPA: hypothetical protein VFQ84_05030 [Arenimonas sp.]|uniref:hypothetical protein n=1 Tax=Arenimonas sp. TaxID=1872635 RepID=UPI002D803DC3|nr:hypothetical protein [Arenimonas sp.]HEU0152691.1 hypothetical protein [Arenimonas sp.]